MHVKRFYQRTVRDALAAAREELGANALVLSTELVPAPGWRGWIGHRMVALTAAIERPPVSEIRPPKPSRRHAGDAARAGVVARLTAAGLESALAEATVARLSDSDCRGSSVRVLRSALAVELGAICNNDRTSAKVEVFVGPPGVGKTTTIAKIAARERAAHGEMFGMIAADAFRAGAVEHLRSYATIVGAPFRVARSADELDRAIDASRTSALVDTAGRSPADDALQPLLAVLARKRDVRTHLVMAADTSAATARKVFDRFASAKPSRVVITKIDEADSFAPLMSVVRERGLRVSYLGNGQRVPEDLERATPQWLAAALLRDGLSEDVPCL